MLKDDMLIRSMIVAAALIVGGLAESARAAEPWKQLFNGKDLTGWNHVGKGSMSVENGLIQTHSGIEYRWSRARHGCP